MEKSRLSDCANKFRVHFASHKLKELLPHQGAFVRVVALTTLDFERFAVLRHLPKTLEKFNVQQKGLQSDWVFQEVANILISVGLIPFTGAVVDKRPIRDCTHFFQGLFVLFYKLYK